MSRLLLLALLGFTAWFSTRTEAATPPPLPLPPCVNGQGACAATNPLLTGTASGTLMAGGSVMITTAPALPVCNHMNGYTYIWSPSGCFAGVSRPTIVSCAYIDLRDMRFKETACQNALYKVPSQAPAPLFTLMRPAGNTDYGGSTQCGATGNYQTYVYGGPASVPEAVWAARGDRARVCELTMAAKRPDGLYGPTWARVRVGIAYGEDGIGRSGRSESAEFYVPIDGDLRGGVDVALMATHQVTGSGDNRGVTLSLVVENKGEIAADSVQIGVEIPKELHVVRASDNRCTIPEVFAGGTVQCNFPLPGKDDALGRNVVFLDVETRMLNAADLEGHISFRATVANDSDPTNNEAMTHVDPSFDSGSWSRTLQLMEPLINEFNYRTPDSMLNLQCDRYMNDIYARLNEIRDRHPNLFADLSFGRITSGRYQIAVTGADAGHVGVVVYQKGTDYRRTGVVIHGTPTWSPTDLDIETAQGTRPMGDHLSINFLREGTADHGHYYRTPIKNFPGSPKQEDPSGCGFEGAYASNAGEFRVAPPGPCLAKSAQQPDIFEEAQSCPFYPDAVVVRTESPVDLLITNARGQRIQTSGGQLTRQELDKGIFSYPVPHADGTFGWVLVLPKDQYDIALTGTGSGPFKLTMRQFDTAGKRVDRVIEGNAVPERVDTFAFDGTTAPVAAPPPAGDGGAPGGGGGAGNGNDGNKGGGGSMDAVLVMGLAALLCVARARRRKQARDGGQAGLGSCSVEYFPD